MVNEAKSGQEHAKKNYELTAKALEKYQKELEQAERELKQMERTGDTSSKAYKDQQKAVEDLRKKVSAQSLEYQKAQGFVGMNYLGFREAEVLSMTPRKFFLLYEQFMELKGLKKPGDNTIDALP